MVRRHNIRGIALFINKLTGIDMLQYIKRDSSGLYLELDKNFRLELINKRLESVRKVDEESN